MRKILMRDDIAELIEVTQIITGLKKGIIEKDYYVTRLLCILSPVHNIYFKLVFAGGTCLAKAHQLTKRMSEDADFKIQLRNPSAPLNKSKFRTEFRKLREQIISSIGGTDLKFLNQKIQGQKKNLLIITTI